jgi:ferric-dicitrate binding protein FerR (iron transport regulator)
MISKEEFVNLYNKFLNNECSDAEKKLLDEYRDEMKLRDNIWEDESDKEEEIYDLIWHRLSENLESEQSGRYLYSKTFWASAAAAILIICSASLFFMKTSKKPGETLPPETVARQVITPGGNKAYLTMANGARIALNDTKNGDLEAQSGIKITKSSNGILVYQVQKTKTNQTDTATKFNTIETPRGGQYQVVLDDGTKVWLNAMSSLRFPVTFNGKQRKVELSGEGYFEVAKDKSKPFLVVSNGSIVRVLGTHFNVNAYRDNAEMTATLLEGSVEMIRNKSNALLVPGQQGKIEANNDQISVSNADLEEVMGWKNGLFIFHKENIVDVMRKVSRWYDVDVEYSGNVKNKVFGGSISRYKDITELLDNLALTQAIHYKIEGRRVTIMN